MAIDTAEKRRSVAGINGILASVTPNALMDVEWRQESGYGYPGILPSAIVVVPMPEHHGGGSVVWEFPDKSRSRKRRQRRNLRKIIENQFLEELPVNQSVNAEQLQALAPIVQSKVAEYMQQRGDFIAQQEQLTAITKGIEQYLQMMQKRRQEEEVIAQMLLY